MNKIFVGILFVFCSSSISFAQADSVVNTDSSNHHPKIGSFISFYKNITAPIIAQPFNKVVYPERMKRNGIEGRVRIWMLFDTLGHVVKTENDESSDPYPDFVQSATNALTEATISPAKRNGKPIRVWWDFPIIFQLSH